MGRTEENMNTMCVCQRSIGNGQGSFIPKMYFKNDKSRSAYSI